MRPVYAEKVLDRSTDLQQGMRAQILSEIVERTNVPHVWVAETVTKNSTVGCSGKDVPKFLSGSHGGKITAAIFESVIHCAVCGSEPGHNADRATLRSIATEISEFFIHPDEKGSHIPSFFQAPRAFVPSPFDYGELAMAIRWMQCEAASLGTGGKLVFTSFDEPFPHVHRPVMEATKRLLESAVIAVEILVPDSQHVSCQSAQSLVTHFPKVRAPTLSLDGYPTQGATGSPHRCPTFTAALRHQSPTRNYSSSEMTGLPDSRNR